MTTSGQAYPWRVACRFQRKDGFIALDQLRTIDRERVTRKLGRLAAPALGAMLALLQELFAP
ncbi:MAG: type II toxin-antitoxin system PemK/MazF family toxin [Gemmatimonadaceae bacterium]|nr:type II toxin-antitoxin system PemK/MazF family toxin [Gemmatimonadaceae bacterium]